MRSLWHNFVCLCIIPAKFPRSAKLKFVEHRPPRLKGDHASMVCFEFAPPGAKSE